MKWRHGRVLEELGGVSIVEAFLGSAGSDAKLVGYHVLGPGPPPESPMLYPTWQQAENAFVRATWDDSRLIR